MVVPPQHVMRFYSNTDYAIQSIGFKEIIFLHSDKLNDPFDPPSSLATDFSESYEALLCYVKQHHEKDLQKFMNRYHQEDWEPFLDRMTDLFNSIRNNTFLFSTISIREEEHPKNNLYMWSHYGNGHRGVAIEYNTDLLTKSVSAKSKQLFGEDICANDIWTEITYADKMPEITCEAIFQFAMSAEEKYDFETLKHTVYAETVELMMRTKSSIWIKEEEWRLAMLTNDETKLKIQRLELLDGAITAVYLGCRVTEHLKESLVAETKRSFPNAKVFKGKQAKGNFALEFEQIS